MPHLPPSVLAALGLLAGCAPARAAGATADTGTDTAAATGSTGSTGDTADTGDSGLGASVGPCLRTAPCDTAGATGGLALPAVAAALARVRRRREILADLDGALPRDVLERLGRG